MRIDKANCSTTHTAFCIPEKSHLNSSNYMDLHYHQIYSVFDITGPESFSP